MGVVSYKQTHYNNSHKKYLSSLNKMGNKNAKANAPVLRKEDLDALVKASGMTEEEVQAYFNNFVKEHKNGKITKQDFGPMMAKVLPKADAAKLEQTVFKVYDANGDGVIDFKEFLVILHMASETSPGELLTKLFTVFDDNQDNEICKNELKKMITDIIGLLQEEEKEVDEMLSVAWKLENAEGKIKIDEYVQACLSKEEFTNLLSTRIQSLFKGE